MRIGEFGDEEASAVSTALTVMREIWGDGAFTAMDVVKAMTPEMHAWPTPANLEEADKTKAEALADALGELVGKLLDRPTAHSIGKLFQKRLVGRPAWIGDGQTISLDCTVRKGSILRTVACALVAGHTPLRRRHKGGLMGACLRLEPVPAVRQPCGRYLPTNRAVDWV